MPVAGQEVGIGRAERAGEQPVADGAAVDEKVLVRRIAARIGRQAGKAGERHALAHLVELERIGLEVRAQHAVAYIPLHATPRQ